MKILSLVLAALFGLFHGTSAHAFPEMVRYGYVNCNSCHVSLTGGGLLNDYGREISREKLAIFKSSDEKSKEQQFGYGIFGDAPFQKYIKAGGDVRSVYYYVNNDNVKMAQTIFMQGDFEAAYVGPKLTAVGTLGVEQPIPGRTVDFISRRHYLQYALTDTFNIRAGKYFPAYGIKTPDHITLTRDPLQLGDNFGSYNLELSYITDQWNAFFTGVFGRYDDRQSRQDRGFTAQVSYAPTERVKVGANTWYGERPNQSRWLAGPFGLISLTKALLLETEIDFQFLKPNNSFLINKGIATTQKLNYELIDGLWVYGIQEYGKINFISEATQAETYGVGVQIFPRSHFEFNLAYERARRGGGNQNFYDYAWFMSHFYL